MSSTFPYAVGSIALHAALFRSNGSRPVTRTHTVPLLLLIVTLGLAGLTVIEYPTANASRNSTTVAQAAQRPPCPPKATAPASAHTALQKSQPHFPIRAAFYYGWGSKSTHYTQTYGVDDPCIHSDAPHRTVSQMRYAQLDAGIASWMGRGTQGDRRFPSLLRAADGTHFRWALYYEPAHQTIRQITSDLNYLARHYTKDRSYLRVSNKPVLFVWAGGSNNCSLTHKWVSANKKRFYLVLKDFYGYQSCHYHPSSWHAYGPASRQLQVGASSFSISPGFWRNGDARPLLGRSTTAWAAAVRAMVRSKAHWQLVTTFNEWGENTAIESASQWRSNSKRGRYLDLLRKYTIGH